MTNLKKLISALPDDCDAMFITSPMNPLYLTNFEFTDGYVLVTKNKSYIITDFRYVEAAKKCADKDFEIVCYSRLSDIKQLLEDNNVKTLMYEESFLSCLDFIRFKNIFEPITFVRSNNVIEKLREYKNDIEAKCVIKAQRIAEKSLKELLSSFDKNMTEKELAAYLEYLMKKNGADGISFDTIVVSGKASSLPHGVPRNKKLQDGFLTIDFGAVYKGYHSDMTRTYCIGKATDEMKKVYNTVLTAQSMAINAIMSGERGCKKIDNIARDYIYENGYEGCFGHGLGHGVGLQIHEAPRLTSRINEEEILNNGHIVTIEPGIYIENKFGVRIEDMIYMSENGPVNITKMPKKLIEL